MKSLLKLFFNYFLKQKLAQGLPVARIVVFFLGLIVLIVLIAGPVGQLIPFFTSSQMEGLEATCTNYRDFDQTLYCETRDDQELLPDSRFNCLRDSEDFERYTRVEAYVQSKGCEEIGGEECTCITNAYLHQRELARAEVTGENIGSGSTIGGIIGGAEIRPEEIPSVASLLEDISDFIFGRDQTPEDGAEHSEYGIEHLGFNSESMQLFREFSQEHDVELRRLVAFARAIASIETNNREFDSNGNPVARFECHVFNRNSNQNVPCTTRDGESFSRVASETNYEAFVRASQINENQAFSSTSFGMFQVLGSNYATFGLSSPQELQQRTLTQEGQVDLFLRFILSRENSILRELRDSQTLNYRIIAQRYNGAQYERNQYHTKLQVAYERYYQEYSSQMGSPELLVGLNINAPELYTQIRSAELSNSQFASRLVYEIGSGTIRDKGLAPILESILYVTAEELNVRVHIYSAGQCPANHPTCGNERTGSRRHDFGNGADIYITRDGQRICNGNPDFDRFVRVAFRNGIQAGGSSPGYMGNCNMHLDIVGTRLGGGIHWRSTNNFVSALSQGIRDRQTTTS
ncbi:MAG: N-acetylmuramidase family protein [Nanoarchaeota archaeon]|nr:N-acetylmuramidase family protein [Nanoarchaeota archaeon]